ncbi:hypothetical protein F511_14254 [Dorcoceras hygrometricum]|uniref:Uncharacterized protein n=1 Tax=Dorcoceras hygrometricum TaxID=472368 RepID=A0A2Z7BPM5_9LAMI|nr:hypothetical protein F511_14254 [Dorcoceras hygrometricum]
MSSGRYMAYSPSPSAPHSPHISAAAGIRSASAMVEQEKYLLVSLLCFVASVDLC